ncbi:MAG TPA: hypothetical protein IAC50_03245 [Candidatus Copromorpha excrementigallinarum]|uniref:Uncharacterized protein n=1 Tax=Candidatus Allocopromorpha excrementigallinarum TaxID=2840742 RepID=A0A9D1I040_9FIRM|nr:hypothetical protein [Candidatus Copromorpha excrementigallinarum]
MTYVIGAVAGLLFGGVIGHLKNLFIWQSYMKKDAAGKLKGNGMGELYTRFLVSFGVNVASLLAAFLMRNIVPFDGIAFIIGTAIALSVMNKVLAGRQKKMENMQKEVGEG